MQIKRWWMDVSMPRSFVGQKVYIALECSLTCCSLSQTKCTWLTSPVAKHQISHSSLWCTERLCATFVLDYKVPPKNSPETWSRLMEFKYTSLFFHVIIFCLGNMEPWLRFECSEWESTGKHSWDVIVSLTWLHPQTWHFFSALNTYPTVSILNYSQGCRKPPHNNGQPQTCLYSK